MITQADYETAATMALEILIDRGITDTPVLSLPILKNYPGVRIMSFAEMANIGNIERNDLIPMFGRNQDVATFYLKEPMEGVKYIVIYNMQLTIETVRRAAARELGHIVMGHSGLERTTDVRRAEAMAFAYHLLSPRPVIHMLQEAGITITMDVLKETIGCAEECVEGMKKVPGVCTPMELNRQVRDLFAPHIQEYIRFYKLFPKESTSMVVDFGAFMDGYEE